MRHSVYVVQDHETGCFLAPENGSVVYTALIRNAGDFPDYETALFTAVDWCERGFTVVELITTKAS